MLYCGLLLTGSIETPPVALEALWCVLDSIAVMVQQLSESADHPVEAVSAAVVPDLDPVSIGAYFPSSGLGATRSNLLRPLHRYDADKRSTKECQEDAICDHKGARHWSLLPGKLACC